MLGINASEHDEFPAIQPGASYLHPHSLAQTLIAAANSVKLAGAWPLKSARKRRLPHESQDTSEADCARPAKRRAIEREGHVVASSSTEMGAGTITTNLGASTRASAMVCAAGAAISST